MGQHVHRLLAVHETTVECSNCGVVPKVIKDGIPKCSVARREGKRRWGNGRQSHGLNGPQARALRSGQVCAICGGPAEVVDHDHQTGKIRGVLCAACNKGLGFFKDNIELLELAMKYLR